jgi:hypothetical protein
LADDTNLGVALVGVAGVNGALGLALTFLLGLTGSGGGQFGTGIIVAAALKAKSVLALSQLLLGLLAGVRAKG